MNVQVISVVQVSAISVEPLISVAIASSGFVWHVVIMTEIIQSLPPITFLRGDMTDNTIIESVEVVLFPEKINISCVTKRDGPLTKIMKLDPATGELIKDGTKCWMSYGYLTTIPFSSPVGFAKLLRTRTTNQAIVHGTSQFKEARIVTKRKLNTATTNGTPVIARSKDHLTYPNKPGVVLFDHDKARERAVGSGKALMAYPPTNLLKCLSEVHPEIASASSVSTPSTSSCIYDVEGNELRGEGTGSHTYLFVKNASDIPRYLEVVGQHLVLAGYGRIEISRAGSTLIRTLVDLVVGSPERLDFVAGAECLDGLYQTLPEPMVKNGDMLDTSTLPDLTPEQSEEYKKTISDLIDKASPVQEEIKSEYIEGESKKLSDDRGISIDEARLAIVSRQDHVLVDDDQLLFAHMKGKPVSVAEVLTNPTDYDKKALADPLEPEYDGGSLTKARFFYNNGNPIINSFAHGQVKYTFARLKKVSVKNRDDSSCSVNYKDPNSILEKYAVKNEYVDKIGNEEFLYDNILIKNHILVIIAESGGGKTTFLFFNVCRDIAKKGFKVYYFDADSPPSDHKRMKEFADEHGIKFLIPDVNQGTSVGSLIADLEAMAESQADLKDYVLIFDTLKKFIDLMSKQSAKEFFVLMRKLTKLGASVILPGHANKHRDSDGNLVFEGVGDVRSDSDDLIFFEKVKNTDGSLNVTTVVDSDKGAKVRGLFKPISFNIDKARQITFLDNPLNMIDLSNTGVPKAMDGDIIAAAEKYLKGRGEPVSQKHLVQHVRDVIEGQAGENRVRGVIAKRAVMAGDYEPSGTRFIYTVGNKNAHLYELPKEAPKQRAVWDDAGANFPVKESVMSEAGADIG